MIPLLLAAALALPGSSPPGLSPPPGREAATPCDRCAAAGREPSGHYRAILVRAAPGRLLELIDGYKRQMNAIAAAGGERPYLMRHSQGDQWDLMVLVPLERNGGVGRRDEIPAFEETLDELVAWREELLVKGPSPAALRERMRGAGFYHIEMFLALPGKRDELLEQRRMENAYLHGIGRRENLIFTREGGAAWDLFTLGAYRDIREFAGSADIPAGLSDRAARQAGFEAANRIGTYLRTLISGHHDTLAVAVP
ncbi:MAG: hypothetical protein ACE5HQ_08945 [Gemmatimonadota bacterium]